MALPTRSIVTQTYEGKTIECVKFSCSEASDFRIESVAPVNDNYVFQMVIRSTAAQTVSVTLGGVTKTISITGTLKRYTLTFLETVVTSSKDLEISFPTGDYWIYNMQVERASSPSGWRPAPEDAADEAEAIANDVAAQKAAAALEAQTQADIFNKLTNGGQVQGIFLQNGKIYINGTYINTGTLTVKKGSTETFYANVDTGVIRIKADEFSLSSGETLASTLADAKSYADNAADTAVDAQTQLDIFNKLTNNGVTQGIYLSSGKVYINASYIRTGAFSVSKNGTETFYVNAGTGVVRIKADEFSLSDGTTLASTLQSAKTYANSGDTSTLNSAKTYANNCDTATLNSAKSYADTVVDSQTQLDIFNKLTNNGQTQGIYLSGGKIYINASYIQTGTISANLIKGGYLQDNQNNMVWDMANGTLTAKKLSITSTYFSLTNTGVITATSGTIGGWGFDTNGLHRTADGAWQSFIGTTGQISRNIAGSGSRTDWIAVFGTKFGITNDGALYCSSGYMDNITLKDSCNIAPVINNNYPSLNKLSTSNTGISVDGTIYASGNITGASVYTSNYQTVGANGQSATYTIKDPNGNSVLGLSFKNGLFVGTTYATGTYTIACSKKVYYTKATKTWWAYEKSTSTSKTQFNINFVSSLSASSGDYSITI